MSPKEWESVISTNLTGSFHLARFFLPQMRKRGWGRIIFLSSVVGQKGIPGTCAYAASKAGLFALTKTLAVENASKGITVNCLALGYFDVGMIMTIPEHIRMDIRDSIPTGRFGTAQEIEGVVRFLIESDYVNGATININGALL
jgi:NAD(P)-dependent dehydrogenase (short-subunit alcohol dehydrogenase family)